MIKKVIINLLESKLNIRKYGHIIDFSFSKKNKELFVELELNGEPMNTTINIQDINYKIVDNQLIVSAKTIQTNRIWLTDILTDNVTNQEFNIEVDGILKNILSFLL